jgi:hypothetical protein
MMNMRAIAFLCAACTLSAVSSAQPANQTSWLCVWHGELDGQPSVVLTLANDTGALGGTVVLNVLEKEEGGETHVVRTEPHTLVNPRVEANVLAFQFKKPDGNLLDFTVKRTADGEATIHCLNCGADAPTVSLARAK